jgi:Rrf2 family protein
MKFNQSTAYAIAAMAYIVNTPDGQAVSNAAVCNACKMPRRYVTQLMRMLVVAGLLESSRGVAGGYKLTKPADEITLLEIVEAIDGPSDQYGPIEVPGMSRSDKAVVTEAFAAVGADARKRLGAVTLADLRAAKAA